MSAATMIFRDRPTGLFAALPPRSTVSVAFPFAGIADAVLSRIAAVARYVRRAEARRAAIRHLDACPDYLLSDIGLARGDIAAAVSTGRVPGGTRHAGR